MNICNYINQMTIVKYVCLIITIVYNLIAIANVKILFALIVYINTFTSNVCICKITNVWSVKKK